MVDDRGDESTSADDRCTRYWYARNVSAWMVDRVSRSETVAKRCSQTPDRPADVLSHVRTFYDNPDTHGVAPTRGLPVKVSRLTDLSYDGSGRLTQVWLPGRASGSDSPNMKFSYLLRKDRPSAVASVVLLPVGGTYSKTVSLFDGALRERQVQEHTHGGGRVVTDTVYDSRGQEAWRTTYGYGGDRTHVTAPQGETATTEIQDARGNVVALSSGQQNYQMRFGAEKYAKFVYSSRYGFSVESDERGYANAAFDGMIGFSDDGRHYRVREANEAATIAGDSLYGRWKPWSDVTVETWLVPANPWHIRIHRIETPRPLHATEGGFAIARADQNADICEEGEGRALARSATDLSAILDLSQGARRGGRVQRAMPNTNLISAKTIVPQLRGEIPAGTTVLVTAVMALPAGDEADAALARPPAPPDLDKLEALFARDGIEVSAIQVPERF
jgi:hypothetical protein